MIQPYELSTDHENLMFFPEPKTKTYKELCVWKYKTFCGVGLGDKANGFTRISHNYGAYMNIFLPRDRKEAYDKDMHYLEDI
jgi:hypothetical protein